MKRHQNIDILIPDFESGEIFEYEISKIETFRFKDSYSKPFKRNYLIELRKIEEKKYEVYYPESVLSASKYFNSLDRFLTKMRNPQNSTIYVSINIEDELELENHKEIQLHLKKLKKNLIEQTSDEDVIDEIRTAFDYLSSREKIERYFLEDLQYIFDYYGLEKEDNVYIDLTPKETIVNKLAKKVGIGLSNIDLVMFDYLENQNFKVESLSGIDTVSTMTRQNFDKIKDDFLSDNFDFDSINDISLDHKKYIFNSRNILKSFSYRSKIDTPNMKKIKEIRVKKNKASSNV